MEVPENAVLKGILFATGTGEGIPLITGSFCSLPFPSALQHLHLDTFRKTVISSKASRSPPAAK